MENLKKGEYQKCEKCKFGKVVEEYWEKEYMQKKATIITQTVAMTLAITSAIINTILLFKK